MAFKWLTQYDSPNFTPASRVPATWGRPRTIEAIAIHWWGDPNTNPSFLGVVNYLCRPGGGSSAHIVATGTGRQAACIVNLSDASWATNQANPYTISIECDPRCRDEDYDTIAEVIAQLRSIYGDLPLVPHKQFVATACPGNYDLGRLDRIARTKDVSKDDAWGDVKNKDALKWVPMDNPRTMLAKTTIQPVDVISGQPVGGTIAKGTPIEFETKADYKNVLWLRTKYATGKNTNTGIRVDDVTEVPVVTTTTTVKPTTTTTTTVKPTTTTTTTRDPNSPGNGESAWSWLSRIWAVVVETLKKFTFTGGK